MKNPFRLTIVPLLLLSVCSIAQGYDPEKINKKAKQQYELAINKADAGDMKGSAQHLENAIKADARYMDAYLSLAGMNGEFKNYQKAVDLYEKARAIDEPYFVEYYLPYSINLAGTGNFQAAQDAIEAFLSIQNLGEASRKAGEYRKKTYTFALEHARKYPAGDYTFSPRNMGPDVNSVDAEYFPSLTADQQQLVFTRRLNNYNEDFYESYMENGTWSKAKGLTGAINTNFNEGAQNISQDGQMLVFTGCNFEIGFGSCDLYFSLKTKNGWSEPRNIGRSVNTEFWESQPCLSPDKTELYFASKRPDGRGGSDIYVSRKLPNGQWGAPENLGLNINTVGDEYCPFIHADNETMYFVSNGLPGYGGDDLFMVKKNADGSWGTPVNLGYPVNTIDNEGSLFITSDGSTAYYASDQAGSLGALDLYTFDLRKDFRPLKTLWVKGRVHDVKTKEGLPSSVELTEINTGRTVSRLQTDEDGNYLTTLPVGKQYAFNVKRKGYLFYSEHYALPLNGPDSSFERNIPLQPFEVDARLTLNNIFFDSDKYELKAASRAELDKIVELLKENPSLEVQINGHTDNTGSSEKNMELSENRARVIVLYLKDKGISADRLSHRGYGDTRPVAGNDSEEGKAKNRRTELQITAV